MTRITVVLIVVLVFAGVLCSDNISMGELPPDIAQQLKLLLENPLAHQLKADCKRGVMRTTPEFLLYTRSNQQKAVTLNISNPIELDSSKKVVVLIHGWLSGPTTYGIAKLKSAYLKRYDCNVIVVNWSKAAWQPYTTAYCYVPGIAQFVAKVLCYLNREINLSLDKIHLVGHSMGAHISGWAGKFIATKCKVKLGRITGLDPSGPIFSTMPDSKRLDKSDALFVDVIHTDGDKFGAGVKMGHSDFHVNCGQHQPGCSDVRRVTNDTLISDGFCSHHRSMEYMAESVNSHNSIAASCGMCPRYCRIDMISEVYRVMGENCRQETRPTRNFYIHTKSSPPYFEGWDTYSGVDTRFV